MARRSPHGCPSAVDGIGCKSEPERSPDHMREGVHALSQDVSEGDGKDLLLAPSPTEHKTEAARSAKAKSIPRRDLLELHVLARDDYVYLVARRGIRSPTAGCEDGIRFDAVGDNRRVLFQREAVAAHVDRALALPEIPTNPGLRRGRRQQELLIYQLAQVAAEER